MASRFATEEEIFSDSFQTINEQLLYINKEFTIEDQSKLNKKRFSWCYKIKFKPVFYGARFWEYPFAILAADLQPGLKCADIGCGTTPFTAYLAQVVGKKNVTGFDPDLLAEKDTAIHTAFGIKRSFIEKTGINFSPDGIDDINAPDETFDRVFCISVLEHISNTKVQQKGIREMVRILKPGGRLIITVDLGIENPLTSPLDIIKFSGLIPVGNVNLEWPEKRFARYEKTTMDVFGLVLEKSTKKIYTDYEGKQTMSMYKANDKAAQIAENFSLPYQDVLIAKDYRRSFGPFRILIKSFLGKYKT